MYVELLTSDLESSGGESGFSEPEFTIAILCKKRSVSGVLIVCAQRRPLLQLSTLFFATMSIVKIMALLRWTY